jgi:colanic acid biosynthesis glycosyl transferase WcaI
LTPIQLRYRLTPEFASRSSIPIASDVVPHAVDRTAGPPQSRVAVITSNFWPERTGIGQVMTDFAQFLSEEGIDVRVATAMPYYPEWRIYDAYRGRLLQTERLGRIVIHRAWHFTRSSPGAFGRIAHEASLCLFALPNMVRVLRGAHVAFIVSPDLSHAFVASLVASAMGVRRVLMVQDVMPDAAVELGMLRNGLVIRLSRWMARRAYAMADEILTLGEGMRRRIARETAAPEKIRIVPNTIDAEELAPGPDQGKPFRDRFVPEGTFAVVHAGNMGQKQDLDLLLRTARRLLEHRDIHFYVFGDGAVKSEFLRKRDEWGLSNVSHFPFQDRAMLPHMLYGADVLLVSQLPEVVDIVVPSKLVTAMGAGAMIVAACAEESEAARLIRESGGGVVTAPSDETMLSESILSIKRDPQEQAAFRVRARDYAVSCFSRKAALGSLIERAGLL